MESVVSLRGLVDDHMKGVGNELEMSEHVVRDTSQRYRTSYPLSVLRARLCHTHMSERHRNALPRKNQCLQN